MRVQGDTHGVDCVSREDNAAVHRVEDEERRDSGEDDRDLGVLVRVGRPGQLDHGDNRQLEK